MKVTAVASGTIAVGDLVTGGTYTTGTRITAIANQILTTVVITGTAGQFSCAAATLAVGQTVTISGTFGGTGSITGYVNPTTYYITVTNGTTTFTLSTTPGGAGVTTTTGTPTGLTYTNNAVGGVGLYTVSVSQTVASGTKTTTKDPGVGFLVSIPQGSTYMTFTFKGRGQTAGSGAAINVEMDLYTRAIQAATPAAVSAWSSVNALTAFATSASNTFWNSYSQTIALSAFATPLVAGQLYQVELTRNTSSAVTNQLAQPWLLGELTIQFS